MFSNKFNKLPDEHMFPMANVGWNNFFKVSVKAIPRNNAIPEVPCPLHDPFASMPSARKSARKSPPLEAGRCSPDDHEEMRRRLMSSKVVDGIDKKDGSPSELMIGDSLLDPPQFLEMYPKRYQSPSRSGSPVMETPEHWMFGGRGHRGRTTHRHADSKNGSPLERGRPWQKKEPKMSLSVNRERDDMTRRGSGKKCLTSKLKELEECCIPEFKCEAGLSPKNGCTNFKKSLYDLSPEETVHVLHAIRQRQSLTKTENFRKTSDADSVSNLRSISSKHLSFHNKNDDPCSHYNGKKVEYGEDINNLLLRTNSNASLLTKPSTNDCFSRDNHQKCAKIKGQGGLPLSPLVYNSTSSISPMRNKTSQDSTKTSHFSSSNSFPTKQTCGCTSSPKFSSYMCEQHNSSDVDNLDSSFDEHNLDGKDRFSILKLNSDCENDKLSSVSNLLKFKDDSPNNYNSNDENANHENNEVQTCIKDRFQDGVNEKGDNDNILGDSMQKLSEEEEVRP